MEEKIIFISEKHKNFYYEKLKEVREQDVYHKALCYCTVLVLITIRENISTGSMILRQDW